MTTPIPLIELAGRCGNCANFRGLPPGHAGICFDKWKGLRWNDAVPLTKEEDTCSNFRARAASESPHG